jgi:hypothetical protein
MEYARRLDIRNVPLRQFGIQFIQIGDDGDASEALKELDANLGSERGIRVRSYESPFLEVDLILSQKLLNTTVFSPNQPLFHTDVILKVVLGENHPELINRLGTPANPNIIVHQL